MKTKKAEQEKMNRRCFLTDCTKLTIGASLIGLSLKSFGNETDNFSTAYTYCIYKCPNPCTSDPSCTGCRTNSALVCTVKECAVAKGLPSCAHCTDLQTCNKELWTNYPGQRQYALQKQTEWGLLSGVNDFKQKQEKFKVFPTATSDNFTIINTNHLDAGFRLFDLNGRIVKEGNSDSAEQSLDISNLTSGSYILNIFNNNEILHVCKIIKK